MKRTRTTVAPPPAPPTPVVPRGPRPLYSGTVVIGPEGYWTTNVTLSLHSIALANTGNFWAIVALDGPSDPPPESGPGVHHLEPGGRERRLPATGHVITIYGTPGELMGLVLWTADNLNL